MANVVRDDKLVVVEAPAISLRGDDGTEYARIENGVGTGLLNSGSISALGGLTAVTLDPDTGDIIFTTNGVERGRILNDGTFSGFADASLVPTLSEIGDRTASLGDIANTASASKLIFICPFDLKIVQASLWVHGDAQSPSNTNYWDIQIRRERANVASIIAEQTTRTTDSGGIHAAQGISQRAAWTFDSAPFDPSNQLCQKDDGVDIAFFPTGTPATLQGVSAMVRYEPI